MPFHITIQKKKQLLWLVTEIALNQNKLKVKTIKKQTWACLQFCKRLQFTSMYIFSCFSGFRFGGGLCLFKLGEAFGWGWTLVSGPFVDGYALVVLLWSVVKGDTSGTRSDSLGKHDIIDFRPNINGPEQGTNDSLLLFYYITTMMGKIAVQLNVYVFFRNMNGDEWLVSRVLLCGCGWFFTAPNQNSGLFNVCSGNQSYNCTQ